MSINEPTAFSYTDEPVIATTRPPSPAEGFDGFYRRFMPRLVGFLMWQGAPGSLAADIAQETMVKAYHDWWRIRSHEAWARRVASRELVRHFSRVLEDPVGDVPEESGPLLAHPDDLAELESRHELLDLLGTLPPRQRQVLAWSVDGYRPAEIAEELGIDPATVRANLMKARRAVAAHLASRGEDA
ncbi:sigma-70 family RNA polymerase sigma factor [Kitasatospora sp. NPDC093806]|uniref:RNA polymerase sigma factor n=1 Tax=Kitasatospora sp. NPDC093806 TaxID=3155075 RepID=UPI003445390D